MQKIKKGDTVQVMTGKDRGKNGKVERVLVEIQKVLVPGLNEYKKHKKPQGEDRPGEIVKISKPLSLGSVSLVCPKCKKPTRVGFRLDAETKVRYCRKCESVI